MKQCVKCGSENEREQIACRQCSNTLVQNEGKKCPFCETSCGPFAKVCSSCGHPLFSQYQTEIETVKPAAPVKDNVISFDAKKLKKKKHKQARKKQRHIQKIGTMILWGAMVVLFILGVISMFL